MQSLSQFHTVSGRHLSLTQLDSPPLIVDVVIYAQAVCAFPECRCQVCLGPSSSEDPLREGSLVDLEPWHKLISTLSYLGTPGCLISDPPGAFFSSSRPHTSQHANIGTTERLSGTPKVSEELGRDCLIL